VSAPDCDDQIRTREGRRRASNASRGPEREDDKQSDLTGLMGNQPHNVEVAAHGQKFLVNTIVGDSDNAPLEVTLNWTTGLKK
jgi:hypothetical protein